MISAQKHETAASQTSDTQSESSTTTQTTTVTVTESTKSKQPTPDSDYSDNEPDDSATVRGSSAGGSISTSSDISDLKAAIANGANEGTAVNIGGASATVCGVGNGYGISIYAAGANTSCAFARAVVNEQLRRQSSSNPDLRNSLSPAVTASSPVTGQRYTMNCSVASNDLITCTGGNNAAVYIY